MAIVFGLVGIAAQCGAWAIRAQEAASAAARVAIADSDDAARDVAFIISGSGATVTINRAGGWITVNVSEATPWGFSISGVAVTRDQD